MARRSTGQVVTRSTKRGTVYALRFYVGGDRHYVTLGTAEEGWTQRRAEDELAATMAAVRAGTFDPDRPLAPPRPRPVEVGWVYFVRSIDRTGPIKIGWASDLWSRLESIARMNPEPLGLLGAFPGTRADETALHRRFALARQRGEWFTATAELVLPPADRVERREAA